MLDCMLAQIVKVGVQCNDVDFHLGEETPESGQ